MCYSHHSTVIETVYVNTRSLTVAVIGFMVHRCTVQGRFSGNSWKVSRAFGWVIWVMDNDNDLKLYWKWWTTVIIPKLLQNSFDFKLLIFFNWSDQFENFWLILVCFNEAGIFRVFEYYRMKDRFINISRVVLIF